MLYNAERDRSVFVVFVFLLATALLAPLPQLSRLAAASRPAHPTFAQLDRNTDGYLDERELAAVPGLAEALERLDRNGDGRLDRAEFARAF